MNNLDKLLEELQTSPKYCQISVDLIRRVGERELRNQSHFKTAVKATKNKLHQVAGAYFTSQVNYADILQRLQTSEDMNTTARELMMMHASSHERLNILDDFYAVTLGDLPPIQRVLDIACGFNPLALPWMPFGEETEYLAYDVYTDLTNFVSAAIPLLGGQGRGICADIVGTIPTEPADLALILKTIPCLEQVDKNLTLRLLEGLQTRFILVSFPLQSLGGRDKGMKLHYEAHLRTLLSEKNWEITRFEFTNEIAFLIAKD